MCGRLPAAAGDAAACSAAAARACPFGRGHAGRGARGGHAPVAAADDAGRLLTTLDSESALPALTVALLTGGVGGGRQRTSRGSQENTVLQEAKHGLEEAREEGRSKVVRLRGENEARQKKLDGRRGKCARLKEAMGDAVGGA